MTDNDYTGIDKLYHFLVCFFLTLLHPILAVFLAVGKEEYDYNSYGHFCLWDLLADALGVLLALPLWWWMWE